MVDLASLVPNHKMISKIFALGKQGEPAFSDTGLSELLLIAAHSPLSSTFLYTIMYASQAYGHAGRETAASIHNVIQGGFTATGE